MLEKYRWYVYELVDPRDQRIFYVGKGKENRIDSHEIEAAKGRISRKCIKIREIQQSGLQIIKRKIALFWDEDAAYECEEELIECYGLENLTNVLPGGRLSYIKARKKKKEKAKVKKISETESVKILARHIRLTKFFKEDLYYMSGNKQKPVHPEMNLVMKEWFLSFIKGRLTWAKSIFEAHGVNIIIKESFS